MLSFASKMMGRVACAQPPLLLQQRLLTTTSSVLGKNSKAPLRPVATHSTKLAGPRSDAHTVLGAVRAMKTMMATAPSRVGQRAFYHTPQAAPSTVVDQLLVYMSANNYAAKEVKATETDKSERKRSKSSKKTPLTEEQEVAALKKEFFKKFKGFKFDPPKANGKFTSYQHVCCQWAAAVPGKVNNHKGPITLEVLDNNKTNVEEICKDFMSTMKIKVPSNARLLEATLFLLEKSLTAKDDPNAEMQRAYSALVEKKLEEKMNCVMLFHRESPPGNLRDDVEEGGEERNQLKEWVQSENDGRTVGSVLMIGGESGSGKTHLGIHMAKIAFTDPPQRTLTLFVKVSSQLTSLNDLTNNIKMPLNPTVEEKNTRNEQVARYLREMMCNLCSVTGRARDEIIAPDASNDRASQQVLDNREKKQNPFDYFHRTVLIIDEAIDSALLMSAFSTSLEKGFMPYMRTNNMEKFFGKVYIVCCSTGSKDVIITSGSCPDYYKSIQMQPSKILFEQMMVNNKALYELIRQHRFMDIVDNRRCAAEAAEFLTSLPTSKILTELQSFQDASQLEIVSRLPESIVTNVIGGQAVMHAASAYASMNALRYMSIAERIELAVSAMAEVLSAASLDAGMLPFISTTREKPDPVRRGIAAVHPGVLSSVPFKQAVDKIQTQCVERKESRTFSFSRAQMVLACSFYGTNIIPLGLSDSFEALSVSMFSLYLSAFNRMDRDKFNLHSFLLLLERAGKTTTDGEPQDTIHKALLDMHPDIPQPRSLPDIEGVFFFDTASTVEGGTPISFDGAQLTDKLIADLRTIREECSIVAVVSPPQSLYAGGFILYRNVFFLMRSANLDDDGAAEAGVRTEIMNMGLIPGGGLTPEEMKMYARNIMLTHQICQAFSIVLAIPVFSVATASSTSRIHQIKVRMPTAKEIEKAGELIAKEENPNKDASTKCGRATASISDQTPPQTVRPITFVPSTSLTAVFTRTVKETKASPENVLESDEWRYDPEETQKAISRMEEKLKK